MHLLTAQVTLAKELEQGSVPSGWITGVGSLVSDAFQALMHTNAHILSEDRAGGILACFVTAQQGQLAGVSLI